MFSYGPPHMAGQKQDDQHEHSFSSYVRIRDVVLKTCQRHWTIGKSGERGSGISVLVVMMRLVLRIWFRYAARSTFSISYPIDIITTDILCVHSLCVRQFFRLKFYVNILSILHFVRSIFYLSTFSPFDILSIWDWVCRRCVRSIVSPFDILSVGILTVRHFARTILCLSTFCLLDIVSFDILSVRQFVLYYICRHLFFRSTHLKRLWTIYFKP